jgi:hypothetical protein
MAQRISLASHSRCWRRSSWVPGGLVQVENQGEGHVGHWWGSSGGYRSWVTISLTRRESSVPRSVQIPVPQ